MPNLPRLLSEAQSAYVRGELDSAALLLKDALECAPQSVEANVLMGVVYARRGSRSEAIRCLRVALFADPACFEAHVALSTLLFAEGEPDQALVHGQKAIALAPDDPASYHHLARGLIAHGGSAEAIPYLRRAVALAPRLPVLVQDLASALATVGEAEQARVLWKQLTEMQPGSPTGWIKLGNAHLAVRSFEDAFVCGRRAIQLAPHSAEARLLVGLALLGGPGGAFEAESHLNQAVKLQQDGLVAHSAYGLALQEMGKFEEARPHFEKAIELCPAHGQAYHSLIGTRTTTEEDRPLLDTLHRHIQDPAASPLDRSYMHYALGKAHEDFGEFQVAMEHFDHATALAAEAWFAGRTPDCARYSNMIEATIATFSSDYLQMHRKARVPSAKPLLVVGMIRSGTTLVEQILSSHPQIKGAGELPFWHERAPRIFDVRSNRVDEVALLDAAQRYAALLDRFGPSHERVVDKLPHNITMLGLVLAAMPHAKVIYVKRNPLDNCLSIYTTAYQHPPEFTLTRPRIAFGYREHERLAQHWRQVIPQASLLEVAYEDLVENTEQVTRKMVEFVGLDWNESCLQHADNQRSVNTPSVWQVRQPVYRSSVGRWRNFEPWLGEFTSLMS